MRRGEIWTIADGGDYATKLRPAVIIQDDRFPTDQSAVVCAFTIDQTEVPLARVRVEPRALNGLRQVSWLMVDKVMTVRRTKIRSFVGRLNDEEVLHLNSALRVFLGLSVPDDQPL